MIVSDAAHRVHHPRSSRTASARAVALLVAGATLVGLSVTAAPQAWAQSDVAHTTVILTYHDASVAQTVRRQGGLTGYPQWVADQIAAAGLSPDQHAVMIVDVTPRYDRIGASTSTYVARINVGDPSLKIDPRIEETVRQKLTSEARQVLAGLAGWSHPLSEGEARLLLAHPGKVDLPLEEPFLSVETWSYQPISVTLAKAPQRGPSPIVNYVAISPDDQREVLSELRVGQLFWVEARFSESPQQQYQQVKITWPDGNAIAPIEPTDHPLVYRGGPFYVAPPPESLELSDKRPAEGAQ
jgi:hypothetical protein